MQVHKWTKNTQKIVWNKNYTIQVDSSKETEQYKKAQNILLSSNMKKKQQIHFKYITNP